MIEESLPEPQHGSQGMQRSQNLLLIPNGSNPNGAKYKQKWEYLNRELNLYGVPGMGTVLNELKAFVTLVSTREQPYTGLCREVEKHQYVTT